MQKLKYIRILIGMLLLVVATMYVLRGEDLNKQLSVVAEIQVRPELLLSELGVMVFWLVMTMVFGRVYCASICPIGVIQDFVRWTVKHMPQKLYKAKPYRYKSPDKLRYTVFSIYALSLVIGSVATVFVVVLSPWTIFRNIIHILTFNPVVIKLVNVSVSAAIGAVCGVLALFVLILMSAFRGREFCNTVCPVGTLMSLTMKPAGSRALVNIDIDPDRCTHCMKCEDICPAKCINLKKNTVDNECCVRCFDCLAVCDDNAIKYGIKRPRLSNTLPVAK